MFLFERMFLKAIPAALLTLVSIGIASPIQASLVTVSGGNLVNIDPATGRLEVIGSLGFSNFTANGLAFDRISGILYAADQSFVYSVNPLTGEANRIGGHGNSNLQGLAFDPIREILYGIGSRRLYSVNVETGQTNEIQSYNTGNYQSLTYYDPEDRLLTGNVSAQELRSIDPFGSRSQRNRPIGSTRGAGDHLQALAYDALNDVLWGISRTSPNSLIHVNPNTGETARISLLGFEDSSSPDLRGLAFITDAVHAPGALVLFTLGLFGLGVRRRTA